MRDVLLKDPNMVGRSVLVPFHQATSCSPRILGATTRSNSIAHAWGGKTIGRSKSLFSDNV